MACKPTKEQMKAWTEIELEHTSDRKVARKIAKDHLREFGCDYYPELIKLEKKLKS